VESGELQKVHFVTGKGGVGKSTFAAALAYSEALKGKKVLLVELGDESFYQHFFLLSKIQFQPVEIKPNFFCAHWVGEQCLRDYLKHLIKSESLIKLFWENPVTKSLVHAAPGLSELSILGKITSGIRHHGPALDFDVIVVDAYATGHFQALLMAPEGLQATLKSGPIFEQGRSIKSVLQNPAITQFHILSLCEEFPLIEALDLEKFLIDYGAKNIQLWLNKVLPLDRDLQKEIYDYLHEKKQRQDNALKILDQKKVYILPWVLKNSVWDVLEGLFPALNSRGPNENK